MENKEIVKDEINLKEFIEVILKGKFLIVLITAVVTLAALGYALFLFNHSYESSSEIYFNPEVVLDATEESEAFFNSINKYSNMNINAYIEQIRSPEVINNVIVLLNLKDKEGQYINYESIRNSTTIANIENTKILNIKVSNSSPELTSKIANALAEEISRQSANNIETVKEALYMKIKTQLQIEEESLALISDKMKEYYDNSMSIVELQGEIDTLISKINGTKSSIIDFNNMISADRESLSVLLNETNIQDISNIETIKIDEDYNATLYKEFELGKISESELQSALMTVEITKLQSKLVQNISNLQVLEEGFDSLNDMLLLKQKELIDNEKTYNTLKSEFDRSTRVREQYKEFEKELEMFDNINSSNDVISVYSLAETPVSPVGRGRSIYVAIGIILGLVLGCGVVFFRYYWKNTTV